MKSYYITGWFNVSTFIPTHINIDIDNLEKYSLTDKNYEINSDYLLGIIDAIGLFQDNILTLDFKDNTLEKEVFIDNISIPYNLENNVLTIKSTNIIDLMGSLHLNSTEKLYIKSRIYPVIKFIKTLDSAVTPTKANFSDVGFDLTIVKLHKTINKVTSMYDTGICLEIPNNYYVEIVPRSSIIKSGFILSNNIGIIDASYKGNLYVCLTKTNLDSEITLPFKCCQLIIRKQEFPIFKEIKIEDIIETKRGEGGFGSTD